MEKSGAISEIVKISISIYDKSPTASLTILFLIVLTPIYIATLSFLNKRKELQLADNKNIRDFQLKASMIKSKSTSATREQRIK